MTPLKKPSATKVILYAKAVGDQWFSLAIPNPNARGKRQTANSLDLKERRSKNPNKVRSLIGAFANANPLHFHAADGSGYNFIANKVIELDRLNPQIASRLVTVFTRWLQYDEDRQRLMKQALETIQQSDKLSRDVTEIVGKSLTAS